MTEHIGTARRLGDSRHRFHEAFSQKHGRMGLRQHLLPLIEYVYFHMQRIPIYTELHRLTRTYVSPEKDAP